MKLAVTAIEKASWETPLVLRGSWKNCIQQAASLGFRGIELHILDSDKINKYDLKRNLMKNNLELTSIGTGPSYSQQHICFTSSNPLVRAEAIKRMQGHLKLGAEFDASVIIGLIKGQQKDCGNQETYFNYFDDGMEECLKIAERLGVTLVLEVIDRFESDWLNTVDEGLKLLDRYHSKWLKLHLDTFHMNIEEPDCVASILKAGRQIGHLHVADSDRWYPGHAHYDFSATFKALHRVGYDGPVVLESFLYPNPIVASQNCLKTLAPLLTT